MNEPSGWARDAEALVRNFMADALGSRALKCSAASRSIGTHMFLEFGELTYGYSRSGTAVPHGEVSLCIHAYGWQLICGGETLMNSETVSDDELSRVFETHLRASPFPEFTISETGLLRLNFDRKVVILVEPHAVGSHDDYYETEVEITTDRQILDLSLAAKSCTVGAY